MNLRVNKLYLIEYYQKQILCVPIEDVDYPADTTPRMNIFTCVEDLHEMSQPEALALVMNEWDLAYAQEIFLNDYISIFELGYSTN